MGWLLVRGEAARMLRVRKVLMMHGVQRCIFPLSNASCNVGLYNSGPPTPLYFPRNKINVYHAKSIDGKRNRTG